MSYHWVICLPCTSGPGAWGHHEGRQGAGRGTEGTLEPHKGLALRSKLRDEWGDACPRVSALGAWLAIWKIAHCSMSWFSLL